MNRTYGITKWTALLCALGMLLFALPGMAQTKEAPVNIVALRGPTAIGMAPMMTEASGAYQFELAGSPDEIVGMVASGAVDIAAAPTNLAAVLYQRLDGGVQLLALNTLGVLYVLEIGDTVREVNGLAGQTLYATGQGAVPEYVMDYILSQNNLTDVTVEYKAEHSELATLMAAGDVTLAMLPEPHVTSVLMKNENARVALDVTLAFADAAALEGKGDTVLSVGSVIVRRAFAEEYPEKVAQFLKDYEASVKFVRENLDEAAEQVAALGILGSAEIAKRAIPQCNIVFITGEAMIAQIEPFFQILYDANPQSVGGALPEADFYYVPAAE